MDTAAAAVSVAAQSLDMPSSSRSTQSDRKRAIDLVDAQASHARRNAMRLRAHRSMALNNHVSASPHFTYSASAHEEAGVRTGFPQFLRSQLNHCLPLHRPSHHSQQLQLRKRSTQTLCAMPSQRSMQLEVPSEPHIKCEEWSDDLSQHHFMPMPMQRYLIRCPSQEITSAATSNNFDLVPPNTSSTHHTMANQAVTHDGAMLNGPQLLPANANNLTYNSAPSAALANKWCLPHLFTNLTTVQPHDASATLLRAVESGSPASCLLDGRTLTQQDVGKYEAVADSQWSSANLSYEALAASSPESVDTFASEIVTPTTSTASSFDRRYFIDRANLGSNSVADLRHKPDAPLHIVAPGSYHHSHPAMAARSESPMFSMEAIDCHDDIDRPADQCYGMTSLPQRPRFLPPVPDVKDERQVKDEQLVAWRDANLSYREIKRRGRFKEAESTLRGRYRALTKQRKDRVRKPQWTDQDCQLLRSAVQRHYRSGAYGKPRDALKVPWKKITLWMKASGSSYAFAPATCAKKWEEIKDT